MPSKDYQPIDISDFCNAGVSALPTGPVRDAGLPAAPVIGACSLRGLPFHIGPRKPKPKKCFIYRGGKDISAVEIPVKKAARYLIVAHRMLESDIQSKNSDVGLPVAKYIVHYANGKTDENMVRERFEIGLVPNPWGHRPFRALPDNCDGMMPRYEGRFEMAGNRQTEVRPAGPRTFYLWSWKLSQPKSKIKKIEIVPQGPKFILGGITLGHLDEEPLHRDAFREAVITISDKKLAAQRFDLEVEVDRGSAGYVWPLNEAPGKEFMNDPLKTWGEPKANTNARSYVEIAASPSAEIRIKSGEKEVGKVNWGKLEKKGALKASKKTRIEIVDGGRNWVHTTVVDDETGKPLPCRIHFKSEKGVPYAPHGYHAHVNSDMGSWHIDNGGDLRMGQITYAYIDGRCQGWLPRGKVIVDAACGFEYEPLRKSFTINNGQRELEIRMKRMCDMRKEGFYSGDTHVHFLSTQGAHLEASGEGLSVLNLLASQWGHLFTNTEELTGAPSVSASGDTIVYASQENRQHILGHLSLLGLKERVAPWCSDGPPEAELGGHLETTLSHWADACHRQGGTIVLPHMPAPNGEPAAMIATSRVDAVEFLQLDPYRHTEYYRYLNAGYRLPLAGGTDKMSSDTPVGIYRTYVQIPENEEFNYDNWCKNLRLGRTFLSGGPLLRFTVEGQPIGSTIPLNGKAGTVEVHAEAFSIFPIGSLEIVQNGKVVASTVKEKGAKHLALKEKIQVEGNSWLTARCGAADYMNPHLHYDGWRRGVMAHTSPIYIAAGRDWEMFDADTMQYMLTLIDGSLTYIRERALRRPADMTTHSHDSADHQEFLERPFQEAMKAIHQRMHQHGIEH